MVRALSIGISVLILVSSCGTKSSQHGRGKTLVSTDTVVLSDQFPNISIQNPGEEPVRFSLKLNDRFPMSMAEMRKEIQDYCSIEKKTLATGAWQFISANTYHLDPYSGLPWVHDPFLVVNSLAGGFCDDRSSALVTLWKEIGFKGRVMELSGHVVPEVLDSGMWRLFDPDHQVYYTDQSGNIIGLEQMEKHACEGLRTIGSNETQGLLWGCELYDSDMQMDLYTTDQDNMDASEWNLEFEPLKDHSFELPPKAELIFYRGDESSHALAVVKLAANSTGLLRVPLVPYAFNGSGTLQAKGRSYTSNTNDISKLGRDELLDSLFIQNVEGELSIYYHINPNICLFAETNTVSIQNSSGKLEISAVKDEPVIYSEQRADGIFIELKRKNHLPYLKQLPRSLPFNSMAGLKREYVKFLKLETGLEPTKRERLIEAYDQSIKLVMDTLRLDESSMFKEANELYPHSVFWMFLPMRYDAYRYLHRIRFPSSDDHLTIRK